MADTNPTVPAGRPVTSNQDVNTAPADPPRVTPRWARWAVLVLAVLGFGGFAVAWLADLL